MNILNPARFMLKLAVPGKLFSASPVGLAIDDENTDVTEIKILIETANERKRVFEGNN